MTTVVMDMSGYDIERAPASEEYGEEVMQSGWNPQLALAVEQPAARRRRTIVDAGLLKDDIDAFLQKMYRFQR